MTLSPEETAAVRSTLGQFFTDQDTEIYLFGSRISGTSRPDSDLDIMLKQATEISFEQIGRVKEAFEESSLPFKADVVDYHRITEAFRRKILSGAKKLTLKSSS